MAWAAAWVDAAYALVSAALFGFVAWRLSARLVEPELRYASGMFSVWWYGVAVFLGTGGVVSILDGMGNTDLAARTALSVLGMVSVCAAVWGLVNYVTYLYWGNRLAFVPGLVFYAMIFVVMVYALASDPAEIGAWHRSVVTLAILTGPVLSAAIIAFLLPAIAALVAYGGLYRKVETRAQRYRILLATGSLASWFGVAIVARAAGFAAAPAWIAAARVIALCAAIGVLIAYAPPAWIQRRLDAVEVPA